MSVSSGLPRLAILISGRGSNFIAIADSVAAGRIQAEIALVISNREDAAGLTAARERGIATAVIPSKGRTREDHEKEVLAALDAAHPNLICLAGYMRLLSPEFVRRYPNRILNIHPSLLPAFPGLEAQRQALDYGARVTGCTVHFVDEHLDHGPILVQRAVPVLPDDDEHTLSARILAEEHIAYTDAVKLALSGNFDVVGRRVVARTGTRQSAMGD